MRVRLTCDGVPDVAELQDAISLADDVPPSADEIARWTDLEKAIVFDWAIRIHLRAQGRDIPRRDRPWVLGRLHGDVSAARIAALESQIETLNQSLERAIEDRDAVQGRIDELESQIEELLPEQVH